MEDPPYGPLSWSASEWSEGAMGESLRLAAESVCVFGGFGASVISVAREGELVAVAVAGAERFLDGEGRPLDVSEVLGTGVPAEVIENKILPLAERWGRLHYIPHHRSDMPEFGWRLEGGYVEAEWHPHDMLLVPVRDPGGRLRGLISLDAPTDGLLPPLERRPALDHYVGQASRILLTALEREELGERQRLAVAARRLLNRAADSDSAEQTLEEVADDLITAFSLAGLRASVFEGDERRVLIERHVTFGDLDHVLDLTLRRAAQLHWERQIVGLTAMDHVLNYDGPPEHLAHLRAQLARRGLDSVLLVPLGAGETCLGALSLYRARGAPSWTDLECEAAQEIGRDLGRLLGVQRALRLEREAVEELRALDGYKSRLIATVAHELKNPIAAIRGNLDLATALTDDLGEAEPALQAMSRGVDRIGRLVDDLLQLAAVDEPAGSVRSPADMTPYVAAGIEQAVESASRPTPALTVGLPEEPLSVSLDPRGIEQIVVNLVSNALKYTPADRWVHLTLRRGEGHAELTVADGGIGIAAEEQSLIFNEFYRSSDPVARQQPGTGLGLAIVQRIVARHGGRVEVDSSPGAGSTFRVLLPLA